jgi:hypothetical protein
VLFSKAERDNFCGDYIEYVDMNLKIAMKQAILGVCINDILLDRRAVVEDFFTFCGEPVNLYVNQIVPDNTIIVMAHPRKVQELYARRYQQIQGVYQPKR